MLEKFKINTATFLCTAFIFRLLFVNMGIASSVNADQSHYSSKKHFSAQTKSGKHFEPSNNSTGIGYSLVEISEEDSNDEDQFKLNPFFVLHVFYSLVDTEIKNILKKITSFNKYFSYNSSHRYIEYSVFRI